MSFKGCFFALIGDMRWFQEVSSLSVEPCEGEFLIVTVFEIKSEEVSSILRLIFDCP